MKFPMPELIGPTDITRLLLPCFLVITAEPLCHRRVHVCMYVYICVCDIIPFVHLAPRRRQLCAYRVHKIAGKMNTRHATRTPSDPTLTVSTVLRLARSLSLSRFLSLISRVFCIAILMAIITYISTRGYLYMQQIFLNLLFVTGKLKENFDESFFFKVILHKRYCVSALYICMWRTKYL